MGPIQLHHNNPLVWSRFLERMNYNAAAPLTFFKISHTAFSVGWLHESAGSAFKQKGAHRMKCVSSRPNVDLPSALTR